MKKISVLIVLFVGLGMNAQVINFPDVNFKNYLISITPSDQLAWDGNDNYVSVDINGNGEIEESEALLIYSLDVIDSPISSLEGLGYFSNLINFKCSGNQSITSVDLEGLHNLETLQISTNLNFSEINTTGLTNLRFLDIFDNPLFIQSTFNHLTGLEYFFCNTLTSLSIDGLPNLIQVNTNNGNGSDNVNAMQSVNLSNLPMLEWIFVEHCQLSSITLSNLPKLWVLWVAQNQLTEIDFSNLNLLGYLGPENNGSFFIANKNQFTSLDFSNVSFLEKNVANNQLVFLNIKDGVYDIGGPLADTDISGNSSLQFICIDESTVFEAEVLGIEDLIIQNGYTNCEINSYCSFVPGGEYYTVSGTTILDESGDGCDENDTLFPNLLFSISNGIESGTLISNTSGDYFIPLEAGNHTLTPTIENPSYFTISPPNLTVDFPTQISPTLQNFCITPNGIHNDVEVTLFPLSPARPGFDAIYVIVYKNKGNTSLSGAVTFEFEDDKMDLISSAPNFSSQAIGIFTYDYLNLVPFETRGILLTLNINSPQETPAVNNGNQLNFTTIINPLSGDEILFDNTSTLKQTVVGSYDPNDKTCIEGDVVGPEMIGQYVHYLIRFENTGTFPAENIVVKDMIDLTKFNLSSLIPTSSSHSFVTRIAADGKVEFIFENIQLPFDDANNDGYIAFKIKTLPSLVVGDTFSNSANIYFDYNFPIVTNTTSTTIEILGNPDFMFGDYLTIYPNPTQNRLNLKTNNEISITSINIYNSLGQLVLVTTNPSQSIDVSNLKTGSYFIKVISDNGISTTQFIKQ